MMYGKDILLLELVNATTAEPQGTSGANKARTTDKTVADKLAHADDELRDVFEALKAFILALGEDVRMQQMKFYFAFKRFCNIACVEIHPAIRVISIFVKVDPETVDLKAGFTRDVRSIGHYGTGDLEITVRSMADLECAKPLLIRSYEPS